jgi:hypothetical protein
MAGAPDPLIESLLGRFYHYQVRTIVTRLNAEVADLRTRLSTALQSVSFYASGGNDGGQRANAILQRLAALHGRGERRVQTFDIGGKEPLRDRVGGPGQAWQDQARLVMGR